MADNAEDHLQFNIKENVRNFLLDEVFSSCKSSKHYDVESGMFMLVVDEKSIAVLNSFVQYTDLMEKGITGIERLELTRKRFPKMHAIYFISSSKKSIDLMADDFLQKPTEDGKKAPHVQYNFIHVIFYNGCSEEMLAYMMSQKHLVPFIINIKAIQLQFMAIDETTFTFNEKGILKTLYTNDLVEEKEQKIQELSIGISTLITSLKDFHNVQVLYSQNSNPVVKTIAERVGARIGKMVEEHRPVSKPAPVTFILMDRCDDLLTPLRHDLYYNSLLMDVLHVEGNKVEYEVQNEKKQTEFKVGNLDETDGVWLVKRKLPFLNAVTTTVDDFNAFLKTNDAAKFQSGNIENLDVEKMSQIIKEMPHYQDLLGEYNFHISIMNRAVELFKRRQVEESAKAEAILCSGVDKDGNPKRIEKQSVATNPDYEYDRVRLALMMLLSAHCNRTEAQTLRGSLSDTSIFIEDAEICYKGLEKLGAAFGTYSLPRKDIPKKDGNQYFELERYMSKIAKTIHNLRTGKEAEGFGKIVLPPSEPFPDIKFKKGALLASKLNQSKVDTSTYPIFIVCVIGGISINEIRELRGLEFNDECQGYTTIMGGTVQSTPIDFLKELMRVVGPIKEDIDEMKKAMEKDQWLQEEFIKDKAEAEAQSKTALEPKTLEMKELPKSEETKLPEEKA
jgi:syntaxin-binding protein 1